MREDAILRHDQKMDAELLALAIHHKGRRGSEDKCLSAAALRGESCIEFAGISLLMAVMDRGGVGHHWIPKCSMSPAFLDAQQMLRLARLDWLARC